MCQNLCGCPAEVDDQVLGAGGGVGSAVPLLHFTNINYSKTNLSNIYSYQLEFSSSSSRSSFISSYLSSFFSSCLSSDLSSDLSSFSSFYFNSFYIFYLTLYLYFYLNFHDSSCLGSSSSPLTILRGLVVVRLASAIWSRFSCSSLAFFLLSSSVVNPSDVRLPWSKIIGDIFSLSGTYLLLCSGLGFGAEQKLEMS